VSQICETVCASISPQLPSISLLDFVLYLESMAEDNSNESCWDTFYVKVCYFSAPID
jgi:hypothetical protein